MTSDTLLFGFLRRKLGTLSQADVDEFNAVLTEWKRVNDVPVNAATAPQPSSGVSVGPDGVSALGGHPAPSEAAFSLIKEFEGYAKALPDGGCEAYPDPGSGGEPWTIGFGSTGPDIHRGTVWTREQAEERLEADVRKFAAGVAAQISARLHGQDPAPTTQNEFDALVSFAYNLGLRALAESSLLRRHLAGDKTGAFAEFGKWIHASGRTLPGLVRRRAAEADLYRGKP